MICFSVSLNLLNPHKYLVQINHLLVVQRHCVTFKAFCPLSRFCPSFFVPVSDRLSQVKVLLCSPHLLPPPPQRAPLSGPQGGRSDPVGLCPHRGPGGDHLLGPQPEERHQISGGPEQKPAVEVVRVQIWIWWCRWNSVVIIKMRDKFFKIPSDRLYYLLDL